MYARGCSTRCQMKLPAIAQRGEGGVGGGSGELRLLSRADNRRSVMQKNAIESIAIGARHTREKCRFDIKNQAEAARIADFGRNALHTASSVSR